MNEHYTKTKYKDTEMLMFYNDFFERIRAVIVNGEYWFVARDVATNLGFSNIEKAIKYHVEEEDRIDVDTDLSKVMIGGRKLPPTPEIATIVDGDAIQFPYILDALNRPRRVTWISEAGVNDIIAGRNDMRGRHLGPDNSGPTIKQFKRWVFGTILPTLRQEGVYSPFPGYRRDSVDNYIDIVHRYERNSIVDEDGFVRMLPKIDGPYYKFIENKYRTRGYRAARANFGHDSLDRV